MLIYLVVMVLVAAVVYLIAAAVFGRGEELAPLPPGASPTRLPAEDATGDDIRAVRFQQVLRGYKMSEVDWVLSRLGAEVDQLRDRIAELEGNPRPNAKNPSSPNPGAPNPSAPNPNAPSSNAPGPNHAQPENHAQPDTARFAGGSDAGSSTTEGLSTTVITALDGDSSEPTEPPSSAR